VLGAAAFSPDSRWLAVIGDLKSVHLFGLDRFKPLGILRASGAIRPRALAFSPDGTKLAAVGSEGRVAVWHLNQIQRRLHDFGLNWPAPPL
jgi:WD40 repeat protein